MNTSQLLQQCCTLIEQKLDWGSSEHWQNQDFDALSTRIFEETQVVLSVSTLKRVWGKVKYESLPSATTLNTLAVFAGYENWRAFRQQVAGNGNGGPDAPDGKTAEQFFHPVADSEGEEEDNEMPAKGNAIAAGHSSGNPVALPVDTTAPRKRHPAWYAIPAVVVVLALAGWMYKKSGTTSSDSYSFSSQPLASGIPNSVIFNYDAEAAGDDSVFIQQSWDPRRRFQVPTSGHTYTSMYYYPGYFRAKLIVGKKIVQEHDLLIPSNGWLAAVEQEPVPVYFNRQETVNGGMLHITPTLMQSKNIPLQPQVPKVRYYYIGDMQGLMNDNFVFETELKSEFGQGSAVCQRVTVLVHCEKAAFMIPLGIPGCVGDMFLMLPDNEMMAANADLSGFGVNMNEWVQLRCEVRNKQIRISVNGKKAFESSFTSEANKIVGVSYRFDGPGAVNGVKLARLNGSTVLADAFD
ncbi:hypothetical protein [Chitinophaga alhagiae]|uniref:hypothetical protein n=1 Tax=Chitinophaga alhagiae TaxID=2203219 RepID=UPI000E5BBAC8|nr:hypothetical protein [Chitinophaga alhagiae]